MKAGFYIEATKHGDFLNQLLKKNYKEWYKTGYNFNYYSGNERIKAHIWFPRLDNKNRSGWKNYKEDDKIIESYVEICDEFCLSNVDNVSERITFEVTDTGHGTCIYKFLGLYYYDKENSVYNKRHVWIRKSLSFNEGIFAD